MLPFMVGAAKLRLSSACKIVLDGNSIFHDYYSLPTMATVLSSVEPVASSGAAVVDCSINGQTWAGMMSATDVESAFDAGKTNVLVCFEDANQAAISTGAEIHAACAAYVAARKAAQPTRKIVLCSGLPIHGYGTASNAAINQSDALRAGAWRAMGADVYCDFRAPGSPFAHDGVRPEPFQLQQDLWHETSGWVHPSEAGKAVMARMIAAAIRRLRA